MRYFYVFLLGIAGFGIEASAQVSVAPRAAALHGLKPILVDGFPVAKPKRAHRHHRHGGYATRYLYPPTYNFEGRSYFYFPQAGGWRHFSGAVRKDEPTMVILEERSRW